MKVKSITVTVERLIALPHFENVKYGISMTAEVPCGEHEVANGSATKATYNELLALCKDKIIVEIDRLKGGQVTTKKKGRI